MRQLFLLLFLVISNFSYANSVNRAFKEFYDSSIIDFNHCGKNIQNFLKYLKKENVDYSSGYVVSLHEDMGLVNHFDARWGRAESYSNGEMYSRSNWYFHVFLVIDGVAYDFSQGKKKTQLLRDYLIDSYIPKFETQPIFLMGKLNKEKVFEKFHNLTFKTYNIDDYRERLGPVVYEGEFIEMFDYFFNRTLKINDYALFENFKVNPNGSVTFLNPMLKTNEGNIPFLSYSKRICQVLGFFGSFTSETEFKVTNNQKALLLNTYINPQTNEVKTSYQVKRTNAKIKRDLFHLASKVTCGKFNNFVASPKN